MNDVSINDVKTLFLDIITRPTQRRLKYLCLGIGDQETYFLCDQNEDDFKFCEIEQVISLFQFKSKIYQDTLTYIFKILCIDRYQPGFLYINDLATALNKNKFDLTKLNFNHMPDGSLTSSYFDEKKQKEFSYVLYKPCTYYFFFKYLLDTYDHYKKILIDKAIPSYDIEIEDDINEPTRFMVPSRDLLNLKIIDTLCEDFRIFVLPTLDFIKFKKLVIPDTVSKAALKIWGSGKLAVGMIGYFENQDVLISMIRNNITIFPQRGQSSS